MNDLALAGAIGTPFLVAFTLILCYCCFCLDRKPSRFFWIQGTKKGILPTHHPPAMFNHYEWGPFINTGNGNFRSGSDDPSPSHTSKTSSIKCGHRRSRRGSRCDHGIHISATYGDQSMKNERLNDPKPDANHDRLAQYVAELRAETDRLRRIPPTSDHDGRIEQYMAELRAETDRLRRIRLDEPRPPSPTHWDEVSDASTAEVEQAEFDAMRLKELTINMGAQGGYRPPSPLDEGKKRRIRSELRRNKERRRARQKQRKSSKSRLDTMATYKRLYFGTTEKKEGPLPLPNSDVPAQVQTRPTTSDTVTVRTTNTAFQARLNAAHQPNDGTFFDITSEDFFHLNATRPGSNTSGATTVQTTNNVQTSTPSTGGANNNQQGNTVRPIVIKGDVEHAQQLQAFFDGEIERENLAGSKSPTNSGGTPKGILKKPSVSFANGVTDPAVGSSSRPYQNATVASSSSVQPVHSDPRANNDPGDQVAITKVSFRATTPWQLSYKKGETITKISCYDPGVMQNLWSLGNTWWDGKLENEEGARWGAFRESHVDIVQISSAL
ncbi:hypothetical protein LTR56_020938 [Elasticomyces elasticus]|nr:hypothetical protein LTR56_020938 [Elasticomyces elasticus]KAK4909838.1 hypothetical protein LTR49_021436 [Elasticomyces elasticus]KAK5749729.1 hypothetical protein LTS12_020227 [Elasticomyces elasticus]